jgi:histidinol-phosphate aminotransferase
MPLSRRDFVRSVGVGGAGIIASPLIAARGQEAMLGELARIPSSDGRTPLPLEFAEDQALRLRIGAGRAIRLDSNENPNGPGEMALDAIRAMFGDASRYPDLPADDLRTALAAYHNVKPDNVVLGSGSGEVLRMAVLAFTSPSRALVTAAPTFENPAKDADTIGSPVRFARVNGALKLDLAAMADACARPSPAGLVFVCNPNNPTGTHHTLADLKDFTRRVLRESPGTIVLIDEAYFDYVEDPAYGTAIPLAMENPRVVVARTFSKIYGMAGLRIGYAIGREDPIAKLATRKLGSSVNILGAAAARASLGKTAHVAGERKLNSEAREFTRRFFDSLGYAVVPSQTNFMMVDIRRSSKEFQEACRKRDVLVGRPFPPLDTHARISIGTMDEMHRAVDVFRQALANA